MRTRFFALSQKTGGGGKLACMGIHCLKWKALLAGICSNLVLRCSTGYPFDWEFGAHSWCLEIKYRTRIKKQENKRLASVLLCLTSQGFNCQELLLEPAGCEVIQISSKRRAFLVPQSTNCFIFLCRRNVCCIYFSWKWVIIFRLLIVQLLW